MTIIWYKKKQIYAKVQKMRMHNSKIHTASNWNSNLNLNSCFARYMLHAKMGQYFACTFYVGCQWPDDF